MDYYDSGRFGDAYCEECRALLLKREAEAIMKGRKSICCANGVCHTEVMKAEYDELQNPPQEFLDNLVNHPEKNIRKEFRNNTMTLNNTYALAPISSEHAPPEETYGRKDWCKYNGMSFFSQLDTTNFYRSIFFSIQ